MPTDMVPDDGVMATVGDGATRRGHLPKRAEETYYVLLCAPELDDDYGLDTDDKGECIELCCHG